MKDQKKAFDFLSDFSENICDVVYLEGTGKNLGLSGEAKVELNRLLKKTSALGISGALKYQDSNLTEVLQQNIAKIITDSNDCNITVLRYLIELTCFDISNESSQKDIAGSSKSKDIPEINNNRNLVVNGDFSQHWSTGWNKRIKDRTDGNLLVEVVPSSSDANDELLHVVFQGEYNYGIVDQDIALPNGLKNLNLNMELKIITHSAPNYGLGGQPIEAFVGIQFKNKTESLGTIWCSNDYISPFQDSILVGTPKSRKPSDDRCVIIVGNGYHRINSNLYKKFLDCFSGVHPEQVTDISIGAVIITRQSQDKAEIYLDNVKLYYK